MRHQLHLQFNMLTEDLLPSAHSFVIMNDETTPVVDINRPNIIAIDRPIAIISCIMIYYIIYIYVHAIIRDAAFGDDDTARLT